MFRNYLLTAWKVFMRRKLFTAINLLCIVLTLVVLMVVTALLQNAFYPTGVEGRSERFLQVAMLEASRTGSGASHRGPLGFKLIERYLKPLQSLPEVEAVSAVTMPETVSVYQPGRVSELLMRHADAEYWRIMDFTLLAGRVPDQDDVAQGRHVLVINASTAARLFPDTAGGHNALALGRDISVGGEPFRVIGVVRDVLHFNALADLWAPVTSYPSTDYRNQYHGNFIALLMAKSPAGLPRIRDEVRRISAGVQFDDPRKWNVAKMWADSKLDMFSRMVTQSQQPDAGAGKVIGTIVLLMLLFMLLPALNLVNLNTGRIMERSAEIGVRKAFGATSAQLVGQLVLENVMLTLAGGALGLLGAQGVLWWLEGSGLIPYFHADLNLPVFGYGLLITLVFGVLSGVLPAWKMSRLDPVHALKGAA